MIADTAISCIGEWVPRRQLTETPADEVHIREGRQPNADGSDPSGSNCRSSVRTRIRAWTGMSALKRCRSVGGKKPSVRRAPPRQNWDDLRL